MAKPKNSGLLAEKLRKLTPKRKLYVLHKFKLFSDDRINWTDEDFLLHTKLQSFKSMLEWETTSEFQEIGKIAISSRSANDLWKVYESLQTKAVDGDIKSIDMLLKLHKELNKELNGSSQPKEQSYDDGLQL
ncbi:hypothetical protein [Aneurinibacillus tyrosinisolvens]|uniref:hypothetical protein n=1 Tax=Aneurinibacillus tyrosinisolvens TaxID=1443435 RepID=UPI00063FBF2F|nr:hypothetical protein [Aneurinibacillus tyrosinisolvens]